MNSICFYAVLYHAGGSGVPLPPACRDRLAELLAHDHALRDVSLVKDYAKGMFFIYKLIMNLCF